MVQIKQSFRHTISRKEKKPVSKLGTEFGGVTKNNQKNYAQTGGWRFTKPFISEKCIGCGICVQNCPEAVIELKNKSGKKQAAIDYDYCKGCGICAEVCPVKAIKLE